MILCIAILYRKNLKRKPHTRCGLESDEDDLKSDFECLTNHYQVLNSVFLVVCLVAMGVVSPISLCISFPDEKSSREFVYQTSKPPNSATGENEEYEDLLS